MNRSTFDHMTVHSSFEAFVLIRKRKGKSAVKYCNKTQKNSWNPWTKLKNLNHIFSQKLNKLSCFQAKSYGPNQIGIEMCFQFVFACTKWLRVPNAPLVCVINFILPEYASVKCACLHPAASRQQPHCKQQMGGHRHLSRAYLSNKELQI